MIMIKKAVNIEADKKPEIDNDISANAKYWHCWILISTNLINIMYKIEVQPENNAKIQKLTNDDTFT